MPLGPQKVTPYVGTSTAIATRYWHTPIIQVTSTSVTVLANRLYAQPLNLPGLTIDRVSMDITTGAAGNCRIGIYTNDNGVPGSPLGAGVVLDTTATAAVEGTITAITLPEWCWICCVFDATPGIRAGTNVATGSIIGTSNNSSAIKGLVSAGASAYGALPDPAPAMGFSASVPLMFVRKS